MVISVFTFLFDIKLLKLKVIHFECSDSGPMFFNWGDIECADILRLKGLFGNGYNLEDQGKSTWWMLGSLGRVSRACVARF